MVGKKSWVDEVTNDLNMSEGKTSNEVYQCTDWLPITSNMCERLFSRAKLIFDERRQNMLPINLEILLYLKLNRDLWSKEDVMDIFKSNQSNKSSYSLTMSP